MKSRTISVRWQAYLPVALGILFSLHAFAQKEVHHREQAWAGYFVQGRITNHFGFWTDIHYRQTDHFFDRPFQLLIRPALTWYVTDQFRVNAGYTFVNHFPAKGLNTSRPEHRAWQQVWWSQKYNGFNTLQWLRLEERFNRKIANDQLQDGYNFNYRLRYNFSLFVPLKGKTLAPKTPFVAVIDEVFINFGDRIVNNTFDQNRFFVGLGYQLTAHSNLQFGYMKVFQQESTPGSYTSTDAIRLFFFQNFDFRPDEGH